MINLVFAGIAAMFVLFAVFDGLFAARRQTPSPFWRLRGSIAFVAYFAVAFYAPVLWDSWFAEHTVLDAGALPLPAQIAFGFLTLQFGVYCWHRLMHNVGPIWRHMHQMHHSAERIDIWGAFWFHPLDMIGWALLGSLALVGVFGVSAAAAIAINLMAVFCSMFQHSNIKTPRWLGYLITRPESHSLHHARGVHRYNYGDVPWFDMLFGTFRNPQEAPAEVGFFDGASQKLWSLLIGKKLA